MLGHIRYLHALLLADLLHLDVALQGVDVILDHLQADDLVEFLVDLLDFPGTGLGADQGDGLILDVRHRDIVFHGDQGICLGEEILPQDSLTEADIEVIEDLRNGIGAVCLVEMLGDPGDDSRVHVDLQLQLFIGPGDEFIALQFTHFLHGIRIQGPEGHDVQHVVQEVRTEGILHSRCALGGDEDKILALGTQGIDRILDQAGLVFHQHALVEDITLAQGHLAGIDQRVDHAQESRETDFKILKADDRALALQILVQILQEDGFLGPALIETHIDGIDFITQEQLPLIHAAGNCGDAGMTAAALGSGHEDDISGPARGFTHDIRPPEGSGQLGQGIVIADDPALDIFQNLREFPPRIHRLAGLHLFHVNPVVIGDLLLEAFHIRVAEAAFLRHLLEFLLVSLQYLAQ